MKYVNVSVKVILDAAGNRPTSGEYFRDEQIQKAFDHLNIAIRKTPINLRFQLLDITNVPGVSQWFNMQCSDKTNMELAAEADPTTYHWNPRAINIYIVNDLDGCGGICSFPSGNPSDEIILIQNDGGILNGAVGWLHELGHYFGLEHTDDDDGKCIPTGGQCEDWCPDKTNVMSRKGGITRLNAKLSACQREIVRDAIEPTTGVRRHVLPGNGAPSNGFLFFARNFQRRDFIIFRVDFSTGQSDIVKNASFIDAAFLMVDSAAGHIYWAVHDNSTNTSSIIRRDLPGDGNSVLIRKGESQYRITAFAIQSGRMVWAESSLQKIDGRYQHIVYQAYVNRSRKYEIARNKSRYRGSGYTSLAISRTRHEEVYAAYGKRIELIKITGGAYILIRAQSSVGRLALDEAHDCLFWFSTHGFAEIFTSNMDGLAIKRILRTGKRDRAHKGFSLSLSEQRIYFAGDRSAIHSCDYQGHDLISAVPPPPTLAGNARSITSLALDGAS